VRLTATDGGAGRDGSLEPEREHRKVRLEDFEARIRALEGWRAEKVREERLAAGCDGPKGRSMSTEGAEQEFEKRVSTISAGAGGVVGGVVAVIVRVLGGG